MQQPLGILANKFIARTDYLQEQLKASSASSSSSGSNGSIGKIIYSTDHNMGGTSTEDEDDEQ